MLAKVNDHIPTALTRKPASHQSLGDRKVQSPTTLAAAPQARRIDVTFDPTAPPSSQFTFDNTTDPTLNRKLYLPLTGPTQITFSLTGAEFPANPINWVNGPPNPPNGTSITVDPPPYYNFPWAFNLRVNYGSVSNILSPTFYLVKALDHVVLHLIYNSDGSFDLQYPDGKTVVEVAGQNVLLNPLPAVYSIVLQGATFHQSPIVWASGTPLTKGWPEWIVPLPSAPGLDPQKTTLTFSIPGPINGQSTGFQFAVDVPNLAMGNTTTVLSPDPIIINATIGDG
ncbi:MAG: hypothetical protein ACJ76Y_08550 [Thermoanaerobaculia bacterium]